MSGITREAFEKIYNQQLVPILRDLEVERIKNDKKAKMSFIFFAVGLIVGIVLINIQMTYNNEIGIGIIILSLVISCILASKIKDAERKKLKRLVVQKILTLYGNLYFSDNKNVISHKEIKDMGLYRSSTSKSTDDVIIGVDKGCNFVIAETKLSHIESRSGISETSVTITDFEGLIVKIQMKKNFTGKTVVGMKGDITKMRGFEKVELESVDFMKNREVYSTDQIEARYILTTAFMERLQALGMNFIKDRISASMAVTGGNEVQINQVQHTVQNIGINVPSIVSNFISGYIDREYVGVSAGFVDNYVYLFIPTQGKDFFEVEIGRGTLLQPQLYYNIYKELETILKAIEYLHLDRNSGL